MCETALRCRDDTCEGFCTRKSALWKFLLKICPNLSEKMGKFSSEFWILNLNSVLEKCKYQMDQGILSYPDVLNQCQKICETYDQEISDLIWSNRQIPFDVLVEGPALLLCEFYSESASEDVKR